MFVGVVIGTAVVEAIAKLKFPRKIADYNSAN